MDVCIRTAKVEDIALLIKFQQDLFTRWDELDPADKINTDWFNCDDSTKELKKFINRDDAILYLAQSGDKILGYIKAEVKQREKFLQKNGNIQEAFIDPDSRGKNIGTQLFEKVLDWFNKNKIEWVMVSTHVKDELANKFWKKRGFEEFNIVYKLRT